MTQAARFRILDAAWAVRGRLRLAWLEVFTAQQLERLAQQQLDLQQAITKHLQQQLAAGEISRQELLRSELQLSQMQLNANTAQKRQAESRVQLATALGLPVTALTEIELDFNQLTQAPALEDMTAAKFRAIALQQRPDILAALADYAAAQAALQLEIANQYPNIQANPGYAWELGENLWSLGASIQLPIFHQNQGLIAEAEAKRRELAVRFTALQTKIIGDIDRAQAGLTAVRAKQQQAAQQKSLQLENLLASEAQFKAGEIDQLALLAAKMEAAIAERSRLDVLLETQQALNNLEDSLRTPINSAFTPSIIDNSAARNILQ